MYNHPQSFNPIKINFHYYQVIFKEMLNCRKLFDKIRIWFMPLRWTPTGEKPMPPEITVSTQKRYRGNIFSGGRTYLVFHALLTAGLMLMVISPKSPWSVDAKWIGAILLWYSVINWGGILESKRWVLASESFRLVLTAGFFAFLSGFMPTIIVLAVSAIALISLVWVLQFFRVRALA